MTYTLARDTIEGVLYLLEQEDGRLPTQITVQVSMLREAARRLRNQARALELLRAVNKTGGVVVEYYQKRPLRDWITELLAEIDGKVETK